MKVWQKVYLAVLILVLFTVNLGLFFASGFLYRQNLSQEESQADAGKSSVPAGGDGKIAK